MVSTVVLHSISLCLWRNTAGHSVLGARLSRKSLWLPPTLVVEPGSKLQIPRAGLMISVVSALAVLLGTLPLPEAWGARSPSTC